MTALTTAARKRTKPGREIRPKSITIDFHSHVAVPAAGKFVAPHLNPGADPLSFFASADTKALNQKQGADIGARISQHDDRLRDLDAMGIDLQVALPPPPQCYYNVPVEIAVKAAQMINDGIAEYCAKKPDRFVGFATCPMTDGNEAAITSRASPP